MLDKLEKLERIARQLEPDQGERELMLDKVRDYAETFLTSLPTAPAYTRDEGRRGFSKTPID